MFAQLAHVARPRIVAQPILRRDAEAAKRQPFRVDEQVDVMAQQLGHVLGILAQRRHADDDDAQVRKQLGPQRVAALETLERAAQDRGR